MVDKNRNPLEFDAVVQQFADAAEALTKVKEQLHDLANLREAEQEANSSLQETAGQVANFAAEAAKSLKGLEDAQKKVVEVLKVGADLLDGTELKRIVESVKAHSQSISGVQSRVDALESKVTELISVADALQNTVESGIKNLSEEIKSVHVDVKTPIIVKRLF